MLAELKKSVNGVISDGRKKRSFAEVLYVCVCVCVCVCVLCMCMCMRMYRMYVCTCMCACILIYVYVHKCACVCALYVSGHVLLKWLRSRWNFWWPYNHP